LTRMRWLLPFLVLPVSFFLSGCPQTTTKNVRSDGGSTLQQQENKGVTILSSDTNIPLFISGIKTIDIKKFTYNNGVFTVNEFRKNSRIIVRTQMVADSWFQSSTWQSAREIDAFMLAARRISPHFSRDKVVQHQSGQDFGFTVSDGNCIYGKWAFNLRGSSSYDNDQGAPDTVVKLDGCGILNDDPQIVFRQIRRMNSTDTAVLATKL